MFFVCNIYGSKRAPVPVSRYAGAKALRHALALPENTPQRASGTVAGALYGGRGGRLQVVLRALTV